MVAQFSKLQEDEYVSLEEWMNYEDPDGEKYEFIGGRLVLMPENSVRHGRIISNTDTAFHIELKRKKSKCWTTLGSQKIYFKEYDDGGVPDLAVICGKPEFKDQSENVLINPMLVVEVLSPSTQDYDKGGKFARYMSLPSFQEYVLISQDTCKVETWFRLEENVWRIARFEGLETVMQLHSLDIDIALADIYFGVEELSEEPFGKRHKKQKRIRKS